MIRQIKYKTLQILLRWITLIWFPNIENGLDLVEEFMKMVQRLDKANGSIYTINHLKLIKRLTMSYIAGNPEFRTSEHIIGINKNNGLPKCITFLHKLIESKDYQNLRFVLTLFSVSRVLPGTKKPNLSTITNPSTSRYQTEFEISRYIDSFLIETNFRPITFSRMTKKNLIYSAKSGPNGQAINSALRDIHSLNENLVKALQATNISHLLNEYKELLSMERIEKLTLVKKFYKIIKLPFKFDLQFMKEYYKDTHFKKDKKLWKEMVEMYSSKTWSDRLNILMKSNPVNGEGLRSRKLSIVPDPEAKARIIAIFDYWSQVFLKQIHDNHFDYLRRLPNDRTFTQSTELPPRLPGHKLYSFDLTAATDRFPLTLQSKVIEKMYSSAIAKSWTTILVDTPFYVPWTNSCCKYESGQPMGAYSSWSTFTITHHLVLHYIHDILGISEKYYIILGDDIVITHDDVAREYLRIMKELGVDISIPKSHISVNVYEFAKRLYLDGKEITGIQVRGFYPNLMKYHLIYQMLFTLIYERGYIPKVKDGTIPPLVESLYRMIGLKEKHVKNLKARTSLLHNFNKFLQFNDVEAWNNEIKRRYPNHAFQSMPALEINNMIYLASDQAIGKTLGHYMNQYLKDCLGPKALDIHAMGLASEHDLWSSPYWYMTRMPVIQAISNLASSLNKARKSDSIKDLVNTIALPSDDVFSESRIAVLAGAKAKLAKITLAKFELHIIRGTLANMPNINLTSTVLEQLQRQIADLDKIKQHHGLVPGENQLDKPKVYKTCPYTGMVIRD
jgi:hypothetical protein